jgi:hypothetical protein
MTPHAPRKLLRCAIYTRKSTEHNLDLEFNSLDGGWSGRGMTMAACPAPPWTGLRCKSCWAMSATARSMLSSSTRSTA